MVKLDNELNNFHKKIDTLTLVSTLSILIVMLTLIPFIASKIIIYILIVLTFSVAMNAIVLASIENWVDHHKDLLA